METWFGISRPEHVQSYITDSNGTHKVPHRVGSQASASLKSIGTQKIPVVLVGFADKDFTTAGGVKEDVNAFYDKFCNGTRDGNRYTGHGSYGSVRDFFVEQSDSIFLPEFEVVGPVTLDKGYAYYGKNNGLIKDINFSQFRDEAIAKAQQEYDGLWSDFDNDNNGTVDMIFFVYAGVGENSSGDVNTIWPKEFTSPVEINGVVYSCSGCTCEMYSATKTDGVGVFIHELSHALGLPDFYDLNSVAFGMDTWSVMDYGEYCNAGFNPCGYTAYERDFMGWRKLITLTEPQVLNIPCFSDGGFGYKVVNEENSNEYYILENRQSKGWDRVLCRVGHGLQITHVDYNSSCWSYNSVNTDANHQRMTIIAANNNYNGTNAANSMAEWKECLVGNLYPGESLNYNLTDETVPAAMVYAGGLMHKPIRNITENEDGTITLCFMTNGKLDIPELNEAEDVDMDSFKATWGSVENATAYVIQLEDEDAGILTTDTLNVLEKIFTELRPSAKLRYKVMAIADSPEDYISSDWSEYFYLETLVDEIKSVDDSDKTVDVYSAQGMFVGHFHADELYRLSLRKGIYVMKYSNGMAKKVMVK